MIDGHSNQKHTFCAFKDNDNSPKVTTKQFINANKHFVREMFAKANGRIHWRHLVQKSSILAFVLQVFIIAI